MIILQLFLLKFKNFSKELPFQQSLIGLNYAIL